ncbi:MAG: energy-coupling factor ABC transporter ATP-binding protein [Haemophilus parahaemolyticus]|uniref:energy-coupling factor ABC transporter ATP-binding protein n=1 Tax=Haemophilus parahaemolyticus TaxID=735 RepID=UPI0026EE17F4|nr:energy-coupling factor ABC transporter ATP-binding protein [Haemophilus parahaemolyticus]MBS6008910.1 energy-coupling factor ABC transporter ATP-binding protein [Haemophilus parahaemolyticus]
MVLNVNHLTLYRNQQAVISDLTFAIGECQKFVLQGEIGSGKSTLLLALLGFVPLHSGEINWFDKSCRQEADLIPLRGNTVGICFQQADDQLFGPTVLDDVAFGCLNQGKSKAEAYQIALEQLEKLGITHLKDRPVNLLSGGEKNFTALAGVLAMQPKMLLLDEPTNGLDAKNKAKLTALLQALELPMLIASHDLAFSEALADEVICL